MAVFAHWWSHLGYNVAPEAFPLVVMHPGRELRLQDLIAMLVCISRLEGISPSAEFKILPNLDGIILTIRYAILQTATTQREDVNLRGLLEHVSDATIGWYHSFACRPLPPTPPNPSWI